MALGTGMHRVDSDSALAEVSCVLFQGPPLHLREAGCLQLSEGDLFGFASWIESSLKVIIRVGTLRK